MPMQLGLDGAFTDFPETQHNYLECRNNINASNPNSNPNATILVSADSPGGPINASEVCFQCPLEEYTMLWKRKGKRRKITPLGVIMGASGPRGSPRTMLWHAHSASAYYQHHLDL